MALRVPIGGDAIQADQLRYLLKVSREMSWVQIQVIPAHTLWHPGMAGPFVVYEFADSPAIVHLEHHRSSAFLYEEPDVVEYQRITTELGSEVTMSTEDSGGSSPTPSNRWSTQNDRTAKDRKVAEVELLESRLGLCGGPARG